MCVLRRSNAEDGYCLTTKRFFSGTGAFERCCPWGLGRGRGGHVQRRLKPSSQQGQRPARHGMAWGENCRTPRDRTRNSRSPAGGDISPRTGSPRLWRFGIKAFGQIPARRRNGQLVATRRRGWRLPSVHELASLVDPTNPGGDPDLPAGHPFSNVQSSRYWSATTNADNPTNAWFVGFFISGGVYLLGMRLFSPPTR